MPRAPDRWNVGQAVSTIRGKSFRRMRLNLSIRPGRKLNMFPFRAQLNDSAAVIAFIPTKCWTLQATSWRDNNQVDLMRRTVCEHETLLSQKKSLSRLIRSWEKVSNRTRRESWSEKGQWKHIKDLISLENGSCRAPKGFYFRYANPLTQVDPFCEKRFAICYSTATWLCWRCGDESNLHQTLGGEKDSKVMVKLFCVCFRFDFRS